MREAEPLNYLLDVEESRGAEALDKERLMQRERGQNTQQQHNTPTGR